MMVSFKSIICVVMLMAAILCDSFQTSRNHKLPSCRSNSLNPNNHRDISLAAGLFGKKAEEPSSSSSSTQADVSTSTQVFSIPVQSIKPGGLRFALGLHLIGLQNTPDKGSWQANQASDTVLDMRFRDGSAMFSISLGDEGISVSRYGQPSLPYLLQESVILHSVLDEINSLANEGDIEEENRLLKLLDLDSIEEVRSTLPARKA
jgi:hypothetical protein